MAYIGFYPPICILGLKFCIVLNQHRIQTHYLSTVLLITYCNTSTYKYAYCNGLMEVYSLNTTPPSVGSDNFTNIHYMAYESKRQPPTAETRKRQS